MTTNDAARFEEACEWFLRLRESQESADVVAAWLTWCRADARNLVAFEEVRTVWWQTRDLSETAVSQARPEAEAPPRSAPRRPTLRRVSLGIAAALVLCAVGALIYRTLPSGKAPEAAHLQTAQREHQGFRLADGSWVELAGDSRLTVRIDGHRRQLLLERGEAYFQVARDRNRPFVVTAGATHVTAIGTSFNVRANDHMVVVAVDEGVVEVAPTAVARAPEASAGGGVAPPIRLRRGQEVSVDVGSHALQVASIEPASVAAWREGRLRFAREPLQSVIASVLAASGQKIVLADPALGELQFTGTVFSSRVPDWVEGLSSIYPVNVRQDGDRYVVEPRSAADSR